MKVGLWTYYLKNALVNILSNRLVHAVSIGTICITMLLLGSFTLFFVNVNNWVHAWGQSLTMSVYVEDGVGQDDLKAIESAIKELPDAEITGFITKEQAEADLIKALGDQAGLLEGLKENPFPASFEVTFRDMQQNRFEPRMAKISLEKVKGVDEVQYSEQWLERLADLMYMLKLAGLVVGGLLCLAVLFIVTNTIKLTIYSRRDEIEILKIVGATDWFVKTPFLVEGAIQGLLSGILALGILFLAYSLFLLKTLNIFGMPLMHIGFLPFGFAFLLVLLSLLLGLMGSLIALGRFFRL